MRITVLMLLTALILPIVGMIEPVEASAKKLSSAEIKDQIADLEDQQKELEKALKDLENRQEETEDQITAEINKKDKVDQEMSIIGEQIANINSQITAYSLLIAAKQEEVEIAEKNLQEMQERYKTRIRAMEEGGTVSYWAVLFEAESFTDLLDRIDIIQEIAAADMNRLEVLHKAKQEVEQAKVAMDEEKKVLDSVRKSIEEKQVLLVQKEEEITKILANLIKLGDEYTQLVEDAEAEAEKLLLELANKQDELSAAEKREYEEWLLQQTGTTRPTTVTDGITWALPTDFRRVSSPFGKRVHPVTGEVGKMHNGIDLAANGGTPIYASRPGTVTAYVNHKTLGNYVIINHHDGYKTVYAHMNNKSIGVVKTGQKVAIGELIGYVGTTGRSTGNHLHFAIIKNGSYVNPAKYIDFTKK